MGLSERLTRRLRNWRIDFWTRRMEDALEKKDWRKLEYCRRIRKALVEDAKRRGWRA